MKTDEFTGWRSAVRIIAPKKSNLQRHDAKLQFLCTVSHFDALRLARWHLIQHGALIGTMLKLHHCHCSIWLFITRSKLLEYLDVAERKVVGNNIIFFYTYRMGVICIDITVTWKSNRGNYGKRYRIWTAVNCETCIGNAQPRAVATLFT